MRSDADADTKAAKGPAHTETASSSSNSSSTSSSSTSTSSSSTSSSSSSAPVVVAALYKFFSFADHESTRGPLLALCELNCVMGTLLLAPEGINGTIAGPRKGVDLVVRFIKGIKGVGDGLSYKESFVTNAQRRQGAFLRMRVRLKKEIVTMGIEGVNPCERVGEYVEPKDWNALIERKDVTLVDTRNTYETRIGSFKGAIDPNTDTFKQFPKWVEDNLDPSQHKSVAMFCTGGIRCEKATSFLLRKGFENVYHLKGGILNYLKEVPETKSNWKGECYVFDERVAVDHSLQVGSYDKCRACRRPINDEDRKNPKYEPGVSCAACIDETTESQKERFRHRHRLVQMAEKSGRAHIGHSARGEKVNAKRARELAKVLPAAENMGSSNKRHRD